VWELELALLTRRIPGRAGRYVYEIDHLQNIVLVGRGVVDIPQATRHGGGPLRLECSEGMYNHGITPRNAFELLGGFFGFGGHLVALRRRVTSEGYTGFPRRRGFELYTLKSLQRNQATIIGQRRYTGHASDRVQDRGIPPSVVENTIDRGTRLPGKKPGTLKIHDPANNVTVSNSNNGTVATVRHRRPR